MASTLDQLRARQCFQFAQGLGDGRLAQVQPFGGTAQVALLGDGDEAAEMAEADA